MNTVILQALATGLPVVSTKHSGIPDEVIDGKSGFLVEEGDFHTLADKILLLVENPQLLPELGCFGRDYIHENFDSKHLISIQVKYYRELLGLNSPSDE